MDELLEKLINDRLTPSELKTLRDHFNAATDEELASLVDCRNLDDADTSNVSRHSLDDMKSGIAEKLFGYSRRRLTFAGIALRVAAVLLPLMLIGGGLILVDRLSTRGGGICTVTTARNETSSLLLSDGTSVKINGNSALTFPSGFRKDRREVTFSGEAYFEVAKNPDVPLIITTPTMTVSVRGTAFNLMARQDSKYSELSLDNGLVTVTRSGKGAPLDVPPGNIMILDNETGEIVVKPIEAPHDSSSWTSLEIYFDNASPAYLIDRIEQAYGVTLDPSITGCIDENFSGTLPADNLDEALRIIKRIYVTK